MAVQVKDKVAKGRHTKAGIAWVGSFTGRDVIVSSQTIHCPITEPLDKHSRAPAIVYARQPSGSSICSN
jgi:hypothetical protein